ncbi:metal-dependent hydrolase [Candidatus Dependentiae bacterium]|nr:metal-dependent hydrolase [Candidatus Dependentiae bacterium]
MPNSRVHLLAGGIVFAGLYCIMKQTSLMTGFGLPQHTFLLGVTLLGSIFPDIDVASNMQKTFYKSMIFILPISFIINRRAFFVLLFLCGLFQVLRHRGITHNPVFLIVTPLAIAGLVAHQQPGHMNELLTSCIFLSTGALSHVGLDRFKTYLLYRKR